MMRLKIGVIWLCIGYSRMLVNSTALEFQGVCLQLAYQMISNYTKENFTLCIG
jgi:hypothetical protein